MQSPTVISLLLFNTILLSSCDFSFGINSGNYTFNDTAIYTATNSGIQAEIISQGSVKDGSDLGDGFGRVKLYLLDQKEDTFFLKTSPENIDSITYRNLAISFSSSHMEKDKLYDYLDSMGIKNLNRNEISELQDAITLINYGHKAVFLKGQTKFIMVDTVKRHSSSD